MRIVYLTTAIPSLSEYSTIEEFLDFLVDSCENEFKRECFSFRYNHCEKHFDVDEYVVTVRPQLYDDLEFVLGYVAFEYENEENDSGR